MCILETGLEERSREQWGSGDGSRSGTMAQRSCDKCRLGTGKYLALGMPRNTGKGSEYHMFFWQEGFVNFICLQKSEYLGVFEYFVGTYTHSLLHAHKHIHTCVCTGTVVFGIKLCCFKLSYKIFLLYNIFVIKIH